MKTIRLKCGLKTIVDDRDYEWASKMRWFGMRTESGGIYVTGALSRVNRIQRHVLLHRMIMEAPKGVECDHKNGNSLDNRRSNLRLVTPSQNNRGFKRKSAGKSSRYRGVCWYGARGKWIAGIGVFIAHGRTKRVHLGYFLREVDAARAYNRSAIRFGFAREALNQIPAA
jgi:hypothetical protein